HFENLAIVARRHVEVAVAVLSDVPNVRGVQAGQRPQLTGKPYHSFIADDRLLELRLVVLRGGMMMPHLDLARLDGRNGHSQKCGEAYAGEAEHAIILIRGV